jgi:hypothetical protein
MKEPSDQYLDGFRRGIKTGHKELIDILIENAKSIPKDEEGYTQTLIRWLKAVKSQIVGK